MLRPIRIPAPRCADRLALTGRPSLPEADLSTKLVVMVDVASHDAMGATEFSREVVVNDEVDYTTRWRWWRCPSYGVLRLTVGAELPGILIAPAGPGAGAGFRCWGAAGFGPDLPHASPRASRD